MCSKTYCFRFVLQNKRNTGDFTFYIFMRAKVTVGGNRVGEDEEKKENKELSLGERRKKGKGEEVRMGVA